MWTAIQYVTTPLSLIAFAVGVFAVVYRARLKHRLEAIKSVPERDRSALLDKSLETYSLTNDNLTRNQKYDLLTRVLENRVRRMKIVAFSVVPIIAIALAVVALVFATNKSKVPVQAAVEVTDDDFIFTFDPPSPLQLLTSETTITATLKDKSERLITVPLTWSLGDSTDAGYVEIFQQGNTVTIKRKPAADEALLKSSELLIVLAVQTTQPLSARAQPSEQFNLIISKRVTTGLPKRPLKVAIARDENPTDLGADNTTLFEPVLFRIAPLKDPQIYIMDNRDRVYDPQTREDGGTNATDIRKIIDEFRLPVHSVVETIYRGWAGERQVTNADLVIIHYHCWQFSVAGDSGNWEQTLREFIGRIARENSNLHFIIYSRIRSFEDPDRRRGGYVLSWRYEDRLGIPGLHGRIHPLHVARASSQFCDQLTKGKLAELMETILKIHRQT